MPTETKQNTFTLEDKNDVNASLKQEKINNIISDNFIDIDRSAKISQENITIKDQKIIWLKDKKRKNLDFIEEANNENLDPNRKIFSTVSNSTIYQTHKNQDNISVKNNQSNFTLIQDNNNIKEEAEIINNDNDNYSNNLGDSRNQLRYYNNKNFSYLTNSFSKFKNPYKQTYNKETRYNKKKQYYKNSKKAFLTVSESDQLWDFTKDCSTKNLKNINFSNLQIN